MLKNPFVTIFPFKKKKSGSLKPLTGLSFLFSLLPSPLPLYYMGHFGLYPIVRYQTCLRVQINALCNFKWSSRSCCSRECYSECVCSEELVAKPQMQQPPLGTKQMWHVLRPAHPQHLPYCWEMRGALPQLTATQTQNSAVKYWACEFFWLDCSLATCKLIFFIDICSSRGELRTLTPGRLSLSLPSGICHLPVFWSSFSLSCFCCWNLTFFFSFSPPPFRDSTVCPLGQSTLSCKVPHQIFSPCETPGALSLPGTAGILIPRRLSACNAQCRNGVGHLSWWEESIVFWEITS